MTIALENIRSKSTQSWKALMSLKAGWPCFLLSLSFYFIAARDSYFTVKSTFFLGDLG
jgi:hypothetical protein